MEVNSVSRERTPILGKPPLCSDEPKAVGSSRLVVANWLAGMEDPLHDFFPPS